MSRWSLWAAERGWADVGLWVAVCFLAKISSHRPTCKTTFARLTHSQAISQSFRVFISFTSRRDTTFFQFSKLFFIQTYRFFHHGDQKISWWTSMQVAGSQLRNPPVQFRQERWLHIWRSISIQHVQMEAGLNSDPGNDSFSDKSVTLSMLIDLLTALVQCHADRRRRRSHQLTSELKRCLLFRKCLRWSSRKAVSVPTSVIGGLGAPERLAILLSVEPLGPTA